MTYEVSVPNQHVKWDYLRDKDRWGIIYYKLCMNHTTSWYDMEFKSQAHYELFMIANSK